MFIFIHIFTNIQYDFRVLGKLLYVQAFIYIFIYLFYLMLHMAWSVCRIITVEKSFILKIYFCTNQWFMNLFKSGSRAL